MEAPAGWHEESGALEREFEFHTFAEAIAFVTRVASVADAENHHPDLDIRYRRVRVRWTTHSGGAITDRDHALAARTSELASPAYPLGARVEVEDEVTTSSRHPLETRIECTRRAT